MYWSSDENLLAFPGNSMLWCLIDARARCGGPHHGIELRCCTWKGIILGLKGKLAVLAGYARQKVLEG